VQQVHGMHATTSKVGVFGDWTKTLHDANVSKALLDGQIVMRPML
jgi:hypothetical protein